MPSFQTRAPGGTSSAFPRARIRFLGVGGGFIRMPALFSLIGVPMPIAVGTDLFEIVISGGAGSFRR